MLTYAAIAVLILIIAFAIAFTLIILGLSKFEKGRKILGPLLGLAGVGWTLFILTIIIPRIIEAGFLILLLNPQKYLTYDEKLMSPDSKCWFALYHDYGGFGDPDWHVFKIPINEKPEKIKIPTAYRRRESSKYDIWKKRMLMWNWSEAGHHTSNPHIEIFNNRYLVFIRGGYYHGLYDIEMDKTLITDESPWHSFVYSDKIKKEVNYGSKQFDAMMHKWVRDTLHNPIKEIIEKNQTTNKTLAEP